LLELIFQGLIEWLYGLILEAWEYFSSSLLDIMSMDFEYLEEHIVLLPTIRTALQAIGWALLIGNLIFQAAKSMMSGLGFEGEDPKLLFTRTFVFSFLLMASPQICTLLLDMTSKAIEVLRVPTAVHITLADNATFEGLAAAWLLVAICGIIVMFKSFKLIIEMAERYVILAMLTISAPLAFGMGGSKNTSDIFSGWCRMYGSMCLLMVLNVVFVKMLLSVLSYTPCGIDVLPWMVLVLTIVKVAKKADAIVTRIGLNPPITGDSLGRSFPGTLTYIVARTAISNATKSFAKGGSGNSGASGGIARNPGPPPGGTGGGFSGGGSSAGGTRGTKPGGTQAGRNSAYSQQHAAQNSTQQTSAQNAAAKQNTSAQFGGQQSDVKEQSAPANAINNSQILQGGVFNGTAGQARKTAVPPGTQRAPTHVKQPAGTMPKVGVPNTSGTGRGGSVRQGASPAAAGTSAAAGVSTLHGTAGTAAKPSEARQTNVPVSGMAGTTSKPASAETRQTNAPARGMAGTAPRNDNARQAMVGTNGTAGMAPTSVVQNGSRQTNLPLHGASGTKPAYGANRQTSAAPNGTAGTGAAPINAKERQANMPISGMAGTTQPASGGARFSNVGTEVSRQGAVNSMVQAREQNHISVNNPATGAGGAPGTVVMSSPTSTAGKGGAAPGGTRSTQRPVTPPASETKAPSASPSAAPGPVTKGPQELRSPGKAGSAADGPTRQTLREPRQGRNSDALSTAAAASQGKTASPASTAQQEKQPVSPAARAPAKGPSPSVHPGMAGTAPDAARASQARETARGAATRSRSVSTATDSLGGKHITFMATDNQKQHADKPAARKSKAKQQSGGRKHGG